MASLHVPPSALASLCEKEIEILRLLARGHTAKSIAARLGRTEASINERLREARRKTGVGSSRELARLLEAQKTWDRNIDLPDLKPAAEEEDRPADKGRTYSKGTLLMLIALPLALAGLAFSTLSVNHIEPGSSAQSAAATQSPLVGSWRLDVDRIPVEERPAAVTIVFGTSTGGMWTTEVEITATDGSIRRAISTASLDGVAVPVSGNMAFIDAVSLRQPSPNTLVMTLSKNGSPVSTRVYTAAKDRQTMTETIVWAGETMPKLETTYFTRLN